MLLELRLRGLGAIDDAVLTLGSGFTALTGETGAGKTMVLSGLALLLGGRADAGAVRSGAPRAEVEGRFRVAPDGPVAQRVAEAGGELDADEVVVARTVGADGRSRAFLGGRSVPVGVLTGLADDLVTVHGQADQRGLLRAVTQRAVLDAYGGSELSTAAADYSTSFVELAAVRAELTDVTTNRRERRLEAEALRHGLGEIDATAPTAGEDVALRAEALRLGHVDALQRASRTAHDLLTSATDGDDVLAALGTARQELSAVNGHDVVLDELAGRVAEAAYLLSDVAADLAAYVDRLEADPTRLATVQERIAQLTTLVRRYATVDEPTVDAVIGWAATARERLATLEEDDDRAEQLNARRDAVLGELTAAAGQLSAARGAAASKLSAAVTAELAGLAMVEASLPVELRRREDPTGLEIDGSRVAFSSSGVDDVEFQLIPHAGAPARPLHRGASGGELSRIMLAVEIVLAGADTVPTFVFDEIDAGVGGRAAVEVGRRLAALAATAQVLVVTHLPQVAAFADHHVVVTKSETGQVVSSGVDLVDGESRLRELSRMLGGLEQSASARDHAAELLELAAVAKADAGGSAPG